MPSAASVSVGLAVAREVWRRPCVEVRTGVLASRHPAHPPLPNMGRMMESWRERLGG